MFSSSPRFDDSIQRSHDVAVLCEIVDVTGTYVVQELDVIGGNVSVDSTRSVRRQCNLTLQDPTGQLVPDQVSDFLQPYSGYYIRLSRGISWRDGTRELFPLGTFASYTPKIADTGASLAITVNGYDKSKIISSTRWTTPYAIADGTNLGTAVHDLIDNRMPGLKYNLEPTSATVPATTLGLDTNNDPWADALAIAAADGMDLFIDAYGIVTMRTIPDYTTGSVVRTYEDDENSVVTEFDRTNDASQTYTGVIVYSEGSAIDPPIRVEVWRTDTALRIPYFFPTALIKTSGQALSTALSLLRRVGNSQFAVGLTTIPDPRMETGDVIGVKRARSKLDDVFVISNFTIPLDAASTMTITTDLRRTS